MYPIITVEKGHSEQQIVPEDCEPCRVRVEIPPEREDSVAQVFRQMGELDLATIKEAIAKASPELRAYIAGLVQTIELLTATAQGQDVGWKNTEEQLGKRTRGPKTRQETTQRRNEEIDKALAAGIAPDRIYQHMLEHFDTLMRGRNKSYMLETMMWRAHKQSKKRED